MTPGGDPLYPDAKLEVIVRVLETERIPYAVGGAISLLYWGEPRATADIDINVFLPASAVHRVSRALVQAEIPLDADRVAKEVAATGQGRFDFHGTPVDLFFSNLPFHDSCSTRAVRVPFGDITMNVLSAEDLVVCKAMFDRPKDWLDVEQVLYTRGTAFDSEYVRRWISEMLGADSERLQRFDTLVAAASAPGMQASIIEGLSTSVDDCEDDPAW